MLQDVLDRLGLGGDGVAFVEKEVVGEGFFAEPDLSEGVEQPLVQVVSDPPPVLDFTWTRTTHSRSVDTFTYSCTLILR